MGAADSHVGVGCTAPRLWAEQFPDGVPVLGEVVAVLKRGVDPNAADRRGDTLLHEVIRRVRVDSLQTAVMPLLRAGANIDVPNALGETPNQLYRRRLDEDFVLCTVAPTLLELRSVASTYRAMEAAEQEAAGDDESGWMPDND